MTDLLAPPETGDDESTDRTHPPLPPPRWTAMVRAAGLGLALAGTIAIGWNHTHPDRGPSARACPADRYVTADGETLHRDPAQGCAWVDGSGERVTVNEAGTPGD